MHRIIRARQPVSARSPTSRALAPVSTRGRRGGTGIAQPVAQPRQQLLIGTTLRATRPQPAPLPTPANAARCPAPSAEAVTWSSENSASAVPFAAIQHIERAGGARSGPPARGDGRARSPAPHHVGRAARSRRRYRPTLRGSRGAHQVRPVASGATRHGDWLAHNPEVAGSNPVPATSGNGSRRRLREPFSYLLDTYLDTLARFPS